MKKIKKLLMFTLALAAIVVCFAFSSSAANTSGYYTYEIVNGKAKITDVNTAISGNVTIPSKIGNFTVAEIGRYAFENCSSMKTVTIPNTVTTMG